MGNKIVNLARENGFTARNKDIRGNALFTIAKREISIGFLLLSV